jgi:uncharacterized protein DUF2510
MALVGRIIGIAAGALLIAGTFLHYLATSSNTFGSLANASFWKLATRADVILLILVVAAMACLAIGFVAAPRVLAAIAAGFAGVAFGVAFPFDARSFNDFGPGMWVMALAALAMFVGAVLASADGVSRDRAGSPSAGASGPPAAPTPPAAPAGAPPGWYPDPGGGGGQRYWSGQGWGSETRP